ncbi:hypothetical protein AMS68_007272 [Peltaster fructicola]|uniref:Exocyst complex component Sec3 PIP2-binding N-terminal domain-containing protein n=1 Tax=Peltaster fructicola TaxID=286661 RepID=A0A6H0Y4A1_9PEZI|nr:hypothetical protein AMS68_007272 [Peltaster fructicola]
MSRPAANGQRNVSNGSVPPMSSNGRQQSTPQQQRDTAPNISRAERFEDEKRRIIESCFSKTDDNGQLQESYITHIRIVEDAVYPSTPPPPDSAQDNKKPRIIIVAVRNTGRVRMHKARENNNGSFSIGKTWNLEELSSIESFSNIPIAPRDDREAQFRTWAGSVGFIVTITKPYYWQAGTSKEKDFFIASTVKIYKKYTKGLVPDLRGFDDKDRAAITGTAPPPSQPQRGLPPPHTGPGAQRLASSSPAPLMPQPPFAAREQSREESRYRGSPGPPSDTDGRATSLASSRMPSESPGPVRAVASPLPRATGQVLRPFAASEQPQVFRPYAASDEHNLQSYASSEHLRANNREPRSNIRPDTSPDTAPNGQLEPPAALRTQVRSDSPTIADHKRSTSRPRDAQDAGIAAETQRHTPDASIPAISAGAALFASSRQRLQQQHQQASPPRRDAAPQHNHAGAPVLPPLNTTTPAPTASQTSLDRPPVSAMSVAPGDAAAFGAITSFWAANAGTKDESPVSPPTPERSRRRPAMETKPSESSLDLRPAPLSQAKKPSIPDSATSLAPSDNSIQQTPIVEEPLEIKPLTVPSRSDQILSNVIASKFLTALSPKDTSPAQTPTDDGESPGEEYRPGLGPMIKKKVVANKFMTAANTAKAFKPRPGGAAEKILKARAERDAMLEPDGINAVVPRPMLKAEEPVPASPVTADMPAESPQVESVPAVTLLSAEPTPRQDKHMSLDVRDETPRASLQPPMLQPEPMEEEQLPQPQIKVKRRSMHNERYITDLGINRDLLEGKGLEFENLLDELGWRDEGLRSLSLADLEQDIKRELSRVEAGSWLSHTDNAREEKVQQVEALLDKVIAECDELDGLLTLYSVELGSLNDDIAFIEAQSQGLQVQSANQKVLHSELQSLVQTMSLNRNVMEPLRYADMTHPDRLEEVESSLVKLYEALITMDPSMRSTTGRPLSRSGIAELELSRMAALREKKDAYMRESAAFCQRLMQHLDSTFAASLNGIKGSTMRPVSGGVGINRLNKDAYNVARSGLWMYSPVVLFTKEANPPAWQTIIRMYYGRASRLYMDAFQENVASWRKAARKPAAEEAELLFTHQEKEGSDAVGVVGLTNTARKLTVKRSQTLAKTLRNASGGTDKHHSPAEHRNPGALMSSEVFAAALDEMAPLINQEQNFIVDMFHVTSMESTDFVDSVTSVPPEQRRGTNILAPKPVEPDREMARRLQGVMEEIFGFFAQDLAGLLDWVISNDPIQGVGVMAGLSKHSFYLQESSQEFLLSMLDQLLTKLRSLWNKFVDEQIRAIEETKVKIHKRKGVISFMKTFPPFSAAVENVFSAVAKQDYEGPAECVIDVRRLIDGAYGKINRAMFDRLKVIAKETPGAMAASANTKQGGTEDHEDKEMLNHQILIIENMNHYIEEVDDGGKDGVLAEWRGRAMLERLEALEAYIARVTRRPLGKLLDFVDSLESLLLSNPTPSTIATRPSYSRKAARTVFSQFDGKEIRRGIETLRRRIEKHFGEGDEEAISRTLVTLVTKECERSYDKIIDRVEALLGSVYPPAEGEKGVELEFTREDVSGFRR